MSAENNCTASIAQGVSLFSLSSFSLFTPRLIKFYQKSMNSTDPGDLRQINGDIEDNGVLEIYQAGVWRSFFLKKSRTLTTFEVTLLCLDLFVMTI